MAFKPIPEEERYTRDKDIGYQACHIDGDLLNNDITNLEWRLPKDVTDTSKKLGKLSNKISPDLARVIRERYATGGVSQTDLAKAYNVHKGTINKLVKGITWKEEDGTHT